MSDMQGGGSISPSQLMLDEFWYYRGFSEIVAFSQASLRSPGIYQALPGWGEGVKSRASKMYVSIPH